MILTLTPNPSLDRTYDLVRLERGGVLRATDTHEHAGGKGINVARALVRHGIPATALLPTGGTVGSRLAALLADLAVPTVAVPISGESRVNVTLAEHDGTTTKINAPGPRLGAGEVTAVLDALDAGLATRPDLLIAAGSLPLGAPDDFYVQVARRAAAHGVPFALDTSGEPLRRAARSGGQVVLKPNDEELSELVGRELVTVGDVVAAARELVAAGTDAVLVSLGAHGALLVHADDWWWAGGPALVPLSTVGAGDMTLTGYLATAGEPRDRLRAAVAWGRAAVLRPGSAVPTPDQVAAAGADVVALDRPEPSLVCKEL